MKRKFKDKSRAIRFRVFFALVHTLIFLIGIIFLHLDFSSNTREAEQNAKAVAVAASTALDLDKLDLLQADESDLAGQAYASVKSSLERFIGENSDTRFAYIYTNKGDSLLILVDSESIDSPDFAPPGKVYEEADPVFFKAFNQPCNKALVTPLVNDRWGTWKSVLVPLCHTETGKVFAVLGVDYPLGNWFKPIIAKTLKTFALFMLSILAVVMLSMLYKNNLLLKEKQFQLLLSNEQAKLEEKSALSAKEKTQMYSDFQQILLDISTDFMPADSAVTDGIVQKALARIGKLIGADRIYLCQYDFDTDQLDCKARWLADGVAPAPVDLSKMPLDNLGDLVGLHKKGKTAFYQENAGDKNGPAIENFAKMRGAKCVFTIPLYVDNSCFGFIGIDGLRADKKCDEYHIRLLAQFSNLLSAALDRSRLLNALTTSEENYRNIFEFAPVGIVNFDKNGIIISCNDALSQILGAPRERILGLDTLSLSSPVAVEYIKRILKGETIEFRGMYETFIGGKEVALLGKFAPILDKEGKVISGLGFIEDITERKKLGDELRLKSLVLDQLEEHITITDLNGKITYVNRIQTEDRNFGKGSILGKSTEVFGEDPTKGATQKEIFELTLKNGSWQGEVINYKANGEEIIMDCKTQLVTDDQGRPVALGGIAQNITARKLMERDLYREKEQFRTTLLSVGDGVIATDAQGKVTIVNKAAQKLLGQAAVSVLSRHIDEVFCLLSEKDGKPIKSSASLILDGEGTHTSPSHAILPSADGTGIFIEETASPIKDENGETTGVVLVFRDFTEKHLRLKEIEYLSYHDYLTGLHNRRYYEKNIKELDTAANLPLALIMADVNGLKLTNDAFGHAAGDDLLRRIAQILHKARRPSDILARIGGDEFVLVLPKTDNAGAEKILAQINKQTEKESLDNLVVSLSTGHAVKTDTSTSLDKLFTQAENAMYRHKLTESSSMRSRTIDMIMTSLFEKSEREMYHSERVGELCEAIAQQMGFSSTQVNQVMLAGLMHDIGKIGVSEEVLNKPGKLSDEERKIVERHCETGYRILSSASEFSSIARYILEHHERPDGLGYPRGLSGEKISLPAKIIAVADAYDAMRSDRSYRKAMKQEDAVKELKKYAGSQFDSEIVRILVEKVLKQPEKES